MLVITGERKPRQFLRNRVKRGYRQQDFEGDALITLVTSDTVAGTKASRMDTPPSCWAGWAVTGRLASRVDVSWTILFMKNAPMAHVLTALSGQTMSINNAQEWVFAFIFCQVAWKSLEQVYLKLNGGKQRLAMEIPEVLACDSLDSSQK